MILLGLAGKAGSGKDTVADQLVRAYGFIKFSFSDALYREVQQAFGLEDEALLRDRATKDTPQAAFLNERCIDLDFSELMTSLGAHDGCAPSPRQILQWWGTEYRRAQEPEYWVNQADAWLHGVRASVTYPEHVPQLFVNTSTRFPNERKWVHSLGGNVWHLRRDGIAAVNDHVSETHLEVWSGERELWNNDTIERLHAGIDLLFTTSAAFVRVEPMLPDVEPTELPTPDGVITDPDLLHPFQNESGN